MRKLNLINTMAIRARPFKTSRRE